MRWGGWLGLAALLGTAAVAFLTIADPAFAFAKPPSGAPGPLIGVGLPVGAVVLAALVARHFRRND